MFEMIAHNPTEGVYATGGDWVHAMEIRRPERLLFLSGTMGLHPDFTAPPTLIDRIANAWLISDLQKAGLLCVDTCLELDAMREAPFQDVPPETLERGAILLDIFAYLGARENPVPNGHSDHGIIRRELSMRARCMAASTSSTT